MKTVVIPPTFGGWRDAAAEARDAATVASPGGAAPFVPATDDLEELARAAVRSSA